MKRVLIWKLSWLAPSETFVRNQIASLGRYSALTVGVHRIDSLLSRPSDRILFDRPGTTFDQIACQLLEKAGYSRRLRKLIEQESPDLIHAHFAGGGMVIRREAKRTRTPLAVTLHGQDITAAPLSPGVKGLYYRYRLRRLFNDASLVIAVSDHLKRLAVGLGADPSKTVVHHMGIPLNQPEISAGVSSSILAVGRLTEKKGFEFLIRAAADLPEELRRTRITVVGDGPLESALKELADDLGVEVAFPGFLPVEGVGELMRERPVVCIPSITASNGDQEGLPTVAMEASAHGCAIAGFVHSGLPDVVESQTTGILVPEKDIAGLARSLTTLLSDPARADQMGRDGRLKMEREFDTERQTEKLEELYDKFGRQGSTVESR